MPEQGIAEQLEIECVSDGDKALALGLKPRTKYGYSNHNLD